MALFFETAEESEVSLETAVRQHEEVAYRLQKLSPEERADFIRLLREVAKDERDQTRRELLERLPEDVGIA